jgi:DNA-binding transcriptional regulator YiaG
VKYCPRCSTGLVIVEDQRIGEEMCLHCGWAGETTIEAPAQEVSDEAGAARAVLKQVRTPRLPTSNRATRTAIGRLRLKLKLRPREAAGLLDLSVDYLRKLETGERWHPTTVQRITRVYQAFRDIRSRDEA